MMSEENIEKVSHEDLLRMSVDIVAAYASKNPLSTDQITEVIKTVYGALTSLDNPPQVQQAEPPKPAVPIRRSVHADYIICLEDGKKLKMLKRHLRTTYGMTPEEYRAKWGLPPDYPMVAPNYAKQRSEFAKEIGLGRKAGTVTKKTRKTRG